MKSGFFVKVPDFNNPAKFHHHPMISLWAGRCQKRGLSIELHVMALTTLPCATLLASDEYDVIVYSTFRPRMTRSVHYNLLLTIVYHIIQHSVHVGYAHDTCIQSSCYQQSASVLVNTTGVSCECHDIGDSHLEKRTHSPADVFVELSGCFFTVCSLNFNKSRQYLTLL
jgi:hypothetical protein